jgi:glutamate synthase (NADPH/NADH) large chain
MLLVDTESGRIVDDEDLKHGIATENPYGEWVSKNLVKFNELPAPPHLFLPDHETVRLRQRAFGYTYEDLTMILAPMALRLLRVPNRRTLR